MFALRLGLLFLCSSISCISAGRRKVSTDRDVSLFANLKKSVPFVVDEVLALAGKSISQFAVCSKGCRAIAYTYVTKHIEVLLQPEHIASFISQQVTPIVQHMIVAVTTEHIPTIVDCFKLSLSYIIDYEDAFADVSMFMQ